MVFSRYLKFLCGRAAFKDEWRSVKATKERSEFKKCPSNLTSQLKLRVMWQALQTVGLKAIAKIHVNLLFFVTRKLVQGSVKMTSDFQLAPSEPAT